MTVNIASSHQLTKFSTHLLQSLAEGAEPLGLAEEICLMAEALIPNKIASLMRLGANGLLSIYAAPHAPADLKAAFAQVHPGSHAGSCGNVVYQGEAVEVGNIPDDSRWDDFRRLADQGALRSCWSYPIRRGGQILGTFAVTGSVSGTPDIDQRLVMEFCASLAGTLLVHQHMARQEAIQRRLYQALFGSLEVLIENDNDRGMMANLCQRLTEDTNFSAVWIGRPDAQGRFEAIAMAGEGVDQIEEARPVLTDDPEAPLIVRAWLTQKTVLSNDLLADVTLKPWHDAFRKNHWLSLLAVPLWRKGERWAVMVMVSRYVDIFDRATIKLCQRVVSLLCHSLDDFDLKNEIKALQYEEAQLARTDNLTGLPNRLAFEEYLPRALARAERHHHVLAVGLLDLDDFKPVNDRWGHSQGDDLLRELAQRMRHQMRESNFIARLGGDEFVIVLEDLHQGETVHQLTQALHRFHQAVESPFMLGGSSTTLWVEMTMGVALFPVDGLTPELLLRNADVAMYQNKKLKDGRRYWWALKAGDAEVPAPEIPFDPFGGEAGQLLDALKTTMEPLVHNYIRLFYRELEQDSDSMRILRNLSEQEYLRLQQMQMAHMHFLLLPATSVEQIIQKSHALGKVHALVGVTGAMITRALSFLRELLRTQMDQLPLVTRQRYRVLRVADARLQIDLEAQLDGMQAVSDLYNAYFTLPLEGALPWLAAAQREVGLLAQLPGMVSIHLMAPQADGTFLHEVQAGSRASQVQQVFEQPNLRPVLDSRLAAGQGLIAQAWYSGQIQRSDAYHKDERTKVWQHALHGFGVRSAAAIPVRGVQELEFVLVLMGEYPNQFSANWTRNFVISVQNRWEQLVRLRRGERFAGLDVHTASLYRERLHSGGMTLHVQPVVDLETGAVFKVEALARLMLDDGKLLSPRQFLGALRSTDLDALFRQGLTQSFQFLHDWSIHGDDFYISLNLSPSTLLHPDCARWVEEALARVDHLSPDHLTLELLENQEIDQEAADRAIDRLEKLGIHLAIDDLGAGFSSLKRLVTLPFDVIKVDQSMVRDIFREPLKTMTLIRTIIQIGYDLERVVIIEGVENRSVLEAVALLGARYVQGYAIARPMPAASFPAWAEQNFDQWRLGQISTLHSCLGALAYHWRYRHSTTQGPWAMPATSWRNCPLTHFFAARDWQATEAAQWHHEIHQPHLPESQRENASKKLREWLVERVKEEWVGQ